MVLGLGVRILGSGFRVQGLGLEKALLLDYTSLSVSLRERHLRHLTARSLHRSAAFDPWP
jgi:hypothetical protein